MKSGERQWTRTIWQIVGGYITINLFTISCRAHCTHATHATQMCRKYSVAHANSNCELIRWHAVDVRDCRTPSLHRRIAFVVRPSVHHIQLCVRSFPMPIIRIEIQILHSSCLSCLSCSSAVFAYMYWRIASKVCWFNVDMLWQIQIIWCAHCSLFIPFRIDLLRYSWFDFNGVALCLIVF